jgi:hypothetical protein
MQILSILERLTSRNNDLLAGKRFQTGALFERSEFAEGGKLFPASDLR